MLRVQYHVIILRVQYHVIILLADKGNRCYATSVLSVLLNMFGLQAILVQYIESSTTIRDVSQAQGMKVESVR